MNTDERTVPGRLCLPEEIEYERAEEQARFILEARAEVERMRAELDHERKVANEQLARAHDAVRERDEARAAESYMERQLLAVKQECAELRDYAETVGLQAVTDASETYKVVVGERDIAEAELARVKKERDALRDALQWYVDHDDTNEGGRWEESNAGWLEGKRRAQALLAPGKKP